MYLSLRSRTLESNVCSSLEDSQSTRTESPTAAGGSRSISPSHESENRTTGSRGDPQIGLAVDLRRADEGTITADLTDLLLQLGVAAAESGTGVAVFLDELQFVDEVQYRALISALHRVTQKSLPIAVAGAALPQIPRLTGKARSYAERLFDFPPIANLDEPAATMALVEPARRQGVELSPETVAKALEWTAGYPFYIQQLGKHCLLYTSPSPRDRTRSRMPSSA